MTLNLSFFGKSCLVIAEAGNLRQLIVTALHQIGLPNVKKVDDVEAAIYELSQSAYDVVICAEAEFAGSVEVVTRIRKDCRGPAAVVPVIYLTGNMDPAHLSVILNSGANSVMTLPIGTRSLLKNLNRALTDSREFIAHHKYRGPCRRGKNRTGKYSGPRRRAADSQHPAPPADPVASREAQAAPVVRAAHQQWLATGVVGMPRQDHPLAIEHLEDGKFGQIAECAILDHHVGKQDDVGTGFAVGAGYRGWPDKAAPHEMLDAICRTAAENAKVSFRNFDPRDAGNDINHIDLSHAPLRRGYSDCVLADHTPTKGQHIG